MQSPTGALHVPLALAQRGIIGKGTRGDVRIDDHHALRNDAPAPQIHVADFAVAHDAFG